MWMDLLLVHSVDVSLEVSGLAECFVAMRTHVRPLSQMDGIFMSLETTSSSEFLGTKLTTVGPLLDVGSVFLSILVFPVIPCDLILIFGDVRGVHVLLCSLLIRDVGSRGNVGVVILHFYLLHVLAGGSGGLSSSLTSLRQSFDLELLGDIQEGVHLVGANGDFAGVDELDNVLHGEELDPGEVDERVGVGITEEDGPQFGTGGCQHHLVSPDLLVLTGQSDVTELSLLLDTSSQAPLVVGPGEQEIIRHLTVMF